MSEKHTKCELFCGSLTGPKGDYEVAIGGLKRTTGTIARINDYTGHFATVQSGCMPEQLKADADRLVKGWNLQNRLDELGIMVEQVPDIIKALKAFNAFYDDLAKSNPGFMGKMALQDYARWNEALHLSEKLGMTSKKS